MNVREYTEADLDILKKLHDQSGFDYKFPDPNDFFSKQVVESEGIAMAAFMKLTAEAYLFCDPEWRNPAWRMEAFRQMEVQCNKDAWKAGVKEVCAFVPPDIVATFGRRLKKMGWDSCRTGWHCFYKGVS